MDTFQEMSDSFCPKTVKNEARNLGIALFPMPMFFGVDLDVVFIKH